jgi:hypothetical protein
MIIFGRVGFSEYWRGLEKGGSCGAMADCVLASVMIRRDRLSVGGLDRLGLGSGGKHGDTSIFREFELTVVQARVFSRAG